MAITDFIAALDETRATLAIVNGHIYKLEAERQQITLAPPHTDDIVAVFMRGLSDVSGGFTRQFAARLNDAFVGESSAAAAASHNSAELLRLDPEKLDREALMTRALKGQSVSELNVGAVTYFLRDQIAAEIPERIAKLCPAAAQGVKRVDRDRALHALDVKLGEARARRDALQAELGAARAAFHR